MNRIEKILQIRAKLSNGEPTIGSWIQIPHPSIAEMMGQTGFDWVAVDMEHGTLSPGDLPDLFRALELGGTLPLVRLAEGTPKECKQSLDAGAGGVIVPMIESASQLKMVCDACRWPPAGTRGVGFSRANLFGKYFDSYFEEAQSPLIVAMIEHIRAVDELDSILEQEGLDAILMGPYDLSSSMGLTGDFENEKFVSVMETVKAKCAEKGVACGVHVVAPDLDELNQRKEEGFLFLPYSLDSVLLESALPKWGKNGSSDQ